MAEQRYLDSIYGELHCFYLPVCLDFEPSEIGKALVAYRYNLSNEQLQTLELLSQGLSNGELAQALHLQEEKSVKNRVQAILEKLGVRRRSQAGRIGQLYGLGKTSPKVKQEQKNS